MYNKTWTGNNKYWYKSIFKVQASVCVFLFFNTVANNKMIKKKIKHTAVYLPVFLYNNVLLDDIFLPVAHT